MKFRRLSQYSVEVYTKGPEETLRVGEALGRSCTPGLLILLVGGLGAGKTCLTQGIGKALRIECVKSPTFIIMSEHDATLPLLHVDLYRLESEAEIDSLDIEEYLEDGFVAVVEWAERWRLAPTESLRIKITTPEGDAGTDSRLFILNSYGEIANTALSALVQNLQHLLEEEKNR